MYDQLYRESRRGVNDLIAPLTADELEITVPACPLWTIADLLAHLAGASASFAGEPDLWVQASRYEFWRGYFGRRSANQLAGWVRSGDAAGFAELLPVFPARDTDLTEPG